MKIHLREGRVVPLAQARLIAFPEFRKLMRDLGIHPRHAKRIWNTITFELLQLGGAFQISDYERVAEAGALRAFLSPTRRLRNLSRIGKKSERALRSLPEKL